MAKPSRPPAQAMSPATAEAVAELTTLYRSLPSRPSPEELDAAAELLNSPLGGGGAAARPNPEGLSREMLAVLLEARRSYGELQSLRQRKEAEFVLELGKRLTAFDELILEAQRIISGQPAVGRALSLGKGRLDKVAEEDEEEEGVVVENKVDGIFDAAVRKDHDADKLNLIQVATLIESSVKNASKVINLQGKLVDNIESLPASLGKLQDVNELNLAENRIVALPASIGGLLSLTKLDLHSNQLFSLPDSLGNLVNLIELDLHANRLTALPATFGKLLSLVDVDLSSNELRVLPDSLENLTRLTRLNVETNNLEELPYTIGSCIALVELRLDFNNLKALPEAVGKLANLEILTLHYNKVRKLPTTVHSLSKLRALDVSFNELELVPENLCLVTSLVSLNVGKNFADLKELPRSIGNLSMLEELDISGDQIRYLPESFRLLSSLRVLRADETPLEVPPRDVVMRGAQAAVQYMADLHAKAGAVAGDGDQSAEKKCCWFSPCVLFGPCAMDETAA